MKPRYPRALAIGVVKDLLPVLEPACERLVVAGSLRRKRPDVGDVELVFIPRHEVRAVPGDLFARARMSLADLAIAQLEESRVLARRLSKTGAETYGPKNKLMVHVATGVPVDLFATTAEAWWNYLVCRTGSAESNAAVATAAQAKGWKWHPCGPGFTDECGRSVRVECEEDVFRLVGLPFKEPKDR